MASKRLYHYCKLSTAVELILPERQLLLNPIGRTNDPRENRSFVFAGLNINASDLANMADRNLEISNEIRRDCKVLCLSADQGYYFGFELSRLWALYGGNHEGVCIALDHDKFLQENADKLEAGFFKQVTYIPLDVKKPLYHREIDHDKIRQIGLANYVRNDFRKEHLDYLFFTKNEEWESEHEMRFVYFSDKMEMEYCTIRNSLDAIYLGVDFKEQDLPALKILCEEVTIFCLDFVDIRLTDRLLSR
ncbi:MAG TPA: DUF2971 domain-containing protein [Chryseolinea sp.]|nr:DUF2971 domain-containing protein [Chryseolinea sp.]